MIKSKRIEGPGAPLFYLVVVTLLFSAAPVTAETVDQASLELCASQETDDLKLACFEAIMQSGRSTISPAPAAPDSRSVGDNNPSVSSPIVEPQTDSDVAAIAKTAPIRSAKLPFPPREDFGSEHLTVPENSDATNQFFHATVVDVTRGYNRSLQFHLANGHVWRQIEPRHFQYPKETNFDVRISQGMMGEYRLRIGEKGRMIRIRRVQ